MGRKVLISSSCFLRTGASCTVSRLDGLAASFSGTCCRFLLHLVIVVIALSVFGTRTSGSYSLRRLTVEELFTCVFQILPLGFPLRLLPAVVELELLELVVFLNSLQVLQEVAELGLEVGQLGLGTEIVKVLRPGAGGW